MKKLSHILFLLLAAYGLSAQAPGYLGKRFYVLGGGVFSVSAGPTANNKGLSDYYGDKGGGFGMNYHYNLQAGYAISRHQAITIMAGYLKTGMYMTAQTPPPFGDINYYYDQHELFYNLRGLSYGFGYQWFKTKKGAIAPFGTYGSVFLRGHSIAGDILDKKTTFSPENTTHQHRLLGIDPHFSYWSAGMEFGQNTIIRDKIVLNYAIQFNYPLFQGARTGGPLSLSTPYVSYDPENPEVFNQETFNNATASRLLKHEFFGVKLGIGLLLF
ncbi:MAG: hypothetical protein IT258_12690 [Saprospiraceae bacterium]|nr:hypothetical protein [Saprospiraceae bacterium]